MIDASHDNPARAAAGSPQGSRSAPMDRRAEMARELADIKALLQARILALAQTLAPDGKRAGIYWIARNPTRNDRHAGSFWIKVSGAPGVWRDEATGDKGDVLKLIQYITGLDFVRALDWARDWLGLARLDNDAIRKARAAREYDAARDAAREERILRHNREQARALWLRASGILNTPAETYLREARGIDVRALPRIPGALRCAVRRHRESGQHLPCLLSMMTSSADDTFAAVHAVFLAPDGRAKADVTPQRKIWPSFKGAAIRLARGETGKSVKDAAALGLLDTLVLCEGVEDGLAIALACPEYRVWAAGSLGNLAQITLPPTCAEVIVAADNDWGKPQAAKQLEAAIVALGRQCPRISVARSAIGKDANDALLSGAGRLAFGEPAARRVQPAEAGDYAAPSGRLPAGQSDGANDYAKASRGM